MASQYTIEEGRTASESPHLKKIWLYFLSISQQTVSVDISKNSAVGKNYAIFES
jgi:hypothetical protein